MMMVLDTHCDDHYEEEEDVTDVGATVNPANND